MIKLVKNEKGSFMIEAMVAVSLAMIGLLGLLSLVVHSLASNQIVVNRLAAAGLAAEGVETVRNLIDVNYAKHSAWNADIRDGIYELNYNCAILTDDQRHCERLGDVNVDLDALFNNEADFLLYGDNGLYNYLGGQPTAFKRLIKIDSGTAGTNQKQMRINSLVKWSDRGKSFTINIEDHFFNWRR